MVGAPPDAAEPDEAAADGLPLPHLSDLAYFPGPEATEASICWGEAHLAWLDRQAAVHPSRRDDWDDARAECVRRLACWALLRAVQHAGEGATFTGSRLYPLDERLGWPVEACWTTNAPSADAEEWPNAPEDSWRACGDLRRRRLWLADLRARLGAQAYLSGRLPAAGLVEALEAIR